jgi:hypothetical protein
MQRWEYCEITWNSEQILCSICSARGIEKRSLDAPWEKILATLGSDGWEMTGVMPSPTGEQEYFFYFKRPLGSSY